MNSEKAVADLIRRWTNDPIQFARDVLPESLWPREWQPEALEAIRDPTAKRVALLACRDAGKTYIGALVALWWITTRPDSLVLITAPIHRQSENLFLELRQLWDASILPKLFPSWEMLQSELRTTRPQWRILAVASDQPANIEGEHSRGPALVIVDEAKGITDETAISVEGVLTHPQSKKVMLSTAGGRIGPMFRAFETEERSDWTAIRIPATSIPRLQAKAAEEERRLGADHPLYRQLWLAEFSDAESYALFRGAAIEQARGRRLPDEDGPRILGVDVSGRGSDDTVVCYRDGHSVLKFATLPSGSEMQTAGWIVRAALDWNGCDTVAIDAAGIGSGVFSRVEEVLRRQRTGISVVGFNAGSSPVDRQKYANAKTEILFHLRDLLESSSLSLPRSCDRLLSEMAGIGLVMASNGRCRSVDPRNSPDFLDAMVCAFAPDLVAGPSIGFYRPSFLGY